MQWIYPIYSLLLVLNIVIISEEDAVTLPETAKLLVRATRVRKHVLAHRDLVSRVVRCRYTDVSRRGFKNRNTKVIVGINVSALECFENDAVVTVETLLESGIVKNPRDGVKILGNGELTKKLTVKADAFSEGAKAKIEALGGTCEVI